MHGVCGDTFREIRLLYVQVAEKGFLRRVHSVVPRNKVRN